MDPRPVLRSSLVDLLNGRRDNDVYAEVPLESGGSLRLSVLEVRYDPTNDVILLVTDQYYDAPEPECAQEVPGAA